jgi:hypothetical protein
VRDEWTETGLIDGCRYFIDEGAIQSVNDNELTERALEKIMTLGSKSHVPPSIRTVTMHRQYDYQYGQFAVRVCRPRECRFILLEAWAGKR